MLVLKGEKRQEKEEKNKNYYFSERSYGSFQRAFELPASVDRDKVAADYAKGVLNANPANDGGGREVSQENRDQSP